jgi:hypothetical protein
VTEFAERYATSKKRSVNLFFVLNLEQLVVSRCEQLSLAGLTYFLGLLSESAFYVVFE